MGSASKEYQSMIKLYLLFFILPLILNVILIKWGQLIRIKDNKKVGVQTIHIDETPRLGGITILIFFSLYVFFYDTSLIYLLSFSLFSLIPAFLEDLGIEIKPLIRFTCILFSSILLILNFKILPEFNIGVLDDILNNSLFKIVFFTIALTALVNGQNIIDGANGLASFTSLISFCCLLYIGIKFNDVKLIEVSSILMLLIICFLIFNYPFGKIFLGDMGSYLLGLLGGYLVIETFAKYSNLSSWSAIIILFYPIIEVIFSYIRKKTQGKSPLLPDDQHLHLKIFFKISQKKGKNKLSNALVAPYLSVIWFTPIILFYISINFDISSKILLLIMIIIYFIYYKLIPKPSD